MVFARSKLMIEEDVYKPYDVVKWDFPIKDTKRFYENIKDMVINSFGVDEQQVQESSFNWDKANNYKVTWKVTKEYDDLTFCIFTLKISAKTSEDGSGTVSIAVEPKLRTEYPQDTIYQKSFFYEIGRMLADKLFYERKRMQYVADAQRLTRKFEHSVKSYSLY